MRKAEENPTQESIEGLAKIRHQYAVILAAKADEAKSPDLYSLAVRYAESATRLSPGVGAYWSLLGSLYTKMDGIPLAELMAEEAFSTAIDLDPADHRARLLLSELFYSQGNYAMSLDQMEMIVSQDSKTAEPSLLFVMLNAYLLDHQQDRGIGFFKNLVKTRPWDANPRFLLAILLNEQGETDAAIEELRKVIVRSGVSQENRLYARQLIDSWNPQKVKK
jgi:tetratricopeptide (TPR) repeat protein